MLKSSLFRNTIIYSIGSVGSKIISFILLPILTFYLNKEDLGIYDLVMTLILLTTPLVSFQLSESIYRFIKLESDELKINKIIFNSLLIIIISIIVFQLIFYLINLFIKSDYYLQFTICLVTSIIYPFLQKILRANNDNKIFTFLGLINSLLILSFNIIFLKYTNIGVNSLFLSLFLSNLICIIIITYRIRLLKYINIRFYDKLLIIKMLKYSIPLIPNSMSWWLINSSDKFLILYFLTLNDNGLYAVATKYPIIMILINSIFILAFQDEKMKVKDNEDLHKETEMFEKFVYFQFILGVLLISSSYLLVKYTVSPEYIDSFKYMMILYFSGIFSALSSYLGVFLLRENKTNIVLKSSIISGICNVLFVFVTIKYIGLYSCAIGSLLGFLALFLFRYKYLNRKYKFTIKSINIILPSIFILFLIVLLSLYVNISFILIPIFGLVFILKEKDNIVKIYRRNGN